jgi:predicted PurR-regulated permease PerM
MVKRDSYFELQHNKTLKILFFLLFGAVIAGLVFIFRYYFWDFLFALLLYMALKPVYDFILRYVDKRGLAAGIMILVMIALVMVPLLLMAVELVSQIYTLIGLVQREIQTGTPEKIYNSEIVQRVITTLNIDTTAIASRVTDFVKNFSGTVLSSLQAVIAYPIGFILDVFLLLLILFFLFKDGHRLSPVVYRTLPFPDDLEHKVIDRLKEVVRVLLTGNLLIMILQGVLVGIGLLMVGIHLAFLGGGLAAILSLIPVIGTSLVWIPAVVYLVLAGSYVKALVLGIWCLGWYLLLENIVKPKVFGEKLNFHPIVFFFLLLGSIQAFGLPGVFVGPLLLTLYFSLWEIYKMLQVYDRDELEACEETPPGKVPGTKSRPPRPPGGARRKGTSSKSVKS